MILSKIRETQNSVGLIGCPDLTNYGKDNECGAVGITISTRRFHWIRCAAFLVPLITVLSGCAATHPGNSAGITYSLPRTDALVKLGVTLKHCDARNAKYDSEVILISVVGAQDLKYHISGEHLSSSKVKRGFSIGVSENGVISSISSSNADRTSAIVSNVLKSVGTVASMIAAADGSSLCKPEVQDAISRVNAITAAIDSIKQNLSAVPPPMPTPEEKKDYVEQVKGFIEQINVLAGKLAALKTGILRVETSGKITLEKDKFPSGYVSIALDEEPFEKWFVSKNKPKISEEFGIEWSATIPAPAPTIVDVTPSQTKNSRIDRECGFEIPLPSPIPVRVDLRLAGSHYTNKTGPSATFYAAQLNDPSSLCLDVGFGESRSVSLKFDRYGRTTEFSWNSEARGEAISGAVAGYSSSLAGTAAALAGKSALALQKEEIDRLNTQKTLNQLRKCQAIIEAGGFTCPTN